MNKIWTTKDDKEIAYRDLTNSHLLNIIRFVKMRAKELSGEVISGGGDSWDVDSLWCEVGYENDWLEKFRYADLLKEAKRRKLIS